MLRQFAEEFKAFAIKGNAIDMAIGIVIGAAFNKIINSIVSDLMMPPLGLLIGGVDFKNLQIVLQQGKDAVDGAPAIAEVAVRYGAFLNSIVEFLIVGLSAFVAVKVMSRVMSARGA
jgi:large conductance mechanosensitive channel